MLYSPLSHLNNEVRILYLSERPRDGGLRPMSFRLEHRSLDEYSAESREYMRARNLSVYSREELYKQARDDRNHEEASTHPDAAGMTGCERLKYLSATTPGQWMPPSNLHKRFAWGDYVAISYVWGDPNDRMQILVNNTPLMITKNLRSILQSLNETWDNDVSTLGIWVDAICVKSSGHQREKHTDQKNALDISKRPDRAYLAGRHRRTR